MMKLICTLSLGAYAVYGITVLARGLLGRLPHYRALLAHIVLSWAALFLVLRCVCDPVLIPAWKDRGTVLLFAGLFWAAGLLPALLWCTALTKDPPKEGRHE